MAYIHHHSKNYDSVSSKWKEPNLKLTVAVPEIWNILEIQKIKICSEVPNFMGKMNFPSKCA